MKKVNIFSLHLCERQSKKYLFFLSMFISVTFLVYGFLFTKVHAEESVTKDYVVTSGSDVSSGNLVPFTDSELGRINASDDKTRLTSNPWPEGGAYDESKYLEFIFSPDIPNDVVIDNVVVNHEYRRSGALDGSKLEVWNGAEFTNFDISKGAINVDQSDSVDLTSYLNTPDKVNSIKIRFLAYRGEGADTTTGHDFVGITVVYHTPEVVIDPPIDPSEDPPVDPPAEVSYTEVGGLISEDTTWTKDKSPYLVTDSISVGSIATLTIDPGVVVKFNEGTSLTIEGILKAEGTEKNKICLTSYLDDYPCNDIKNEEEGTSAGQGDWDFVVIDNNKDKSTINYLIERYSSSGLILYDGSAINSDGFDTDKDIDAFSSDSSFSNLKAAQLSLYEASSLLIENSIILNEEYGSIVVEENSHLDLNNSKIYLNNIFYGVNIYDNSTASFDGVEIIGGDSSSTTAVAVYENSTLSFSNGSLKNIVDGFEIFNNSNLSFVNSSIDCSSDGFVTFDNSLLNISGGSISCTHDGILVFRDSLADIKNTKISGASDAGIITFGNSKPDAVKVSKSEIFENGYGFISRDNQVLINKNSIHDNFSGGVLTFPSELNPVPITLNFASNYWGDPSGPTHSSNPNGTGEEVSDYVNFLPFLKSDPLKQEGLSNIMFIPGFQASRMYKMVGDSELGTEFENKLWEPGALGDVSGMYMDESGNSIDRGVYTRDVVDEAHIFGLDTINFYKSFMSKLDGMVLDGEISAWKPIAYDWRQSQIDIVNRGIEKTNGDISYLEELTEDQVPYIIGELQKLVDSSNSGKVTIVTHSNGGLVAKALVSKLIEMKNSGKSDLIDKIDNLIEVAPPLVGTPKAIMGVLHGYNQGVFGNLLLGRKKARDFGLNIPGAYGLLPSNKYISSIENDQIFLDSSLDKLNNWRQKYGDSINTYAELKNFLIDADGMREKPDYDDLVNPTILNKKILDKAELLHDKIDNLVIPENIKVHQVIGWGLPTPYDISYKSKNECLLFSSFLCSKKKFVLSSDIDFSSGGDGTVVGGSAAYGEGEEYYLNLKEYNKDNKFDLNKDHVDMFEVPSLFYLIQNILKSDANLPEYITSVAPSPVEYTVLKMRSPVSMDVYDENDLHTGAEEEGIPNSLYMEFGDDKYLVVPKEGNYTLKLTGLSDGIFTFEQQQVSGDRVGGSVVFRDIPTTALLRGKADIRDGSLVESILIDKMGDETFEEIKPSNIQEEIEIKEVKKLQESSGSLPPLLALATSLQKEGINTNENVTGKIIDSNTEDNIKKTNKILQTREENKNENISQEENVLSASVGSTYASNPFRFKLQLVIVGVSVLLLLGLKFIFKVL